MKKIFLSLMAFVTAVMLVACGSKVDLEKIVKELTITYAAGDSSQSVTKDITLPTADVEGAKITWSSNNAAITIQGNKGIVNRGAADVNVTLTVKATFEDKEATETFVVIVKKVEDGGNGDGGNGGDGGNIDANLVVDFDFTQLAEATSYVTTLTATSVFNKVDSSTLTVQRIHSNISKETNSGVHGLVLAIRSNSGYASPSLQTAFVVEGLSKIEISLTNWNNDAKFNKVDFLEKMVVEVSTDGTTWTEAKDVTSSLLDNTADVSNISVQLATAGNYYVRLNVIAKTGIQAEQTYYALRYIATSMKLYGTKVVSGSTGGDGGNNGGNDGGNTGGETPVGDAAIVFDFASTTLGTSYSSNQAAAKTIQNTVNSSNINVVSTRVASNNNHGTYKDPFLVMSASTKEGNKPASIEMNLGMEVKSMSFDAAFWSDFDATQTTKLEIQVLVDGVWTKLFDVKAAMSGALSYINIVVNNINASSIRIYAEGTAPTGTGNNGARIIFDNMKFFA